MESALIGIIGGVLICLMGFIITVLMATRADMKTDIQAIRTLIDSKMSYNTAMEELKACRDDKAKAWAAIDDLRKEVWGGTHHAK